MKRILKQQFNLKSWNKQFVNWLIDLIKWLKKKFVKFDWELLKSSEFEKKSKKCFFPHLRQFVEWQCINIHFTALDTLTKFLGKKIEFTRLFVRPRTTWVEYCYKVAYGKLFNHHCSNKYTLSRNSECVFII